VDTQQSGYARNAYRSIEPEYLVSIGICTHLGCSPNSRPDIAPQDLAPNWFGGYICPCHGSRSDLAGRVYQQVPASTTPVVPLHSYVHRHCVPTAAGRKILTSRIGATIF
jgi:ubiquinol-cytochrome c reductase iron-sulfur subunit